MAGRSDAAGLLIKRGYGRIFSYDFRNLILFLFNTNIILGFFLSEIFKDYKV